MALMQWDLNNKRQSLLGLRCIDKGLDVRYLRYCYMAFFTTSGPIGFVSLFVLVYNDKNEVTLLINPVVGLFL
ncbi:MAG TPA: hypothetical protein ENK09_03155 [Nitrospirae bacterium]|nr:hypothetical protein [Nitrospirota bacterium]